VIEETSPERERAALFARPRCSPEPERAALLAAF
jgi:hypothetical protein